MERGLYLKHSHTLLMTAFCMKLLRFSVCQAGCFVSFKTRILLTAKTSTPHSFVYKFKGLVHYDYFSSFFHYLIILINK